MKAQEKVMLLNSMVNSMSNFKNDESKVGKDIYNNYKVRCEELISELKADGVSEVINPHFKNAVQSFKYWN